MLWKTLKKLLEVFQPSALWVKISADNILRYFSYYPRKQVLTFHANCLHWRQFAWNIKTCFLGKIRKISSTCRLLKQPREVHVMVNLSRNFCNFICTTNFVYVTLCNITRHARIMFCLEALSVHSQVYFFFQLLRRWFLWCNICLFISYANLLFCRYFFPISSSFNASLWPFPSSFIYIFVIIGWCIR